MSDARPASTRPPRAGGARRGARRGARAFALLVAALSGLALLLVVRYFVRSGTGQAIEAAAYEGADFGQNRLWQVAEPVLDVVSIEYVAVAAGVAVLVALLRRRWALALQAIVLVGGANLTTQAMKRVLERPDLGFPLYGNTLPSGHSTVAASVALALLIVVPRAARPWVALLGAAYAAATGVSTLVGNWHLPSDVVAAGLVVLVWTGLVCAATPASGLDPPGRRNAAGTGVAAAVLGVVALVAAVPAAVGLLAAWREVDAGGEPSAVVTYGAGAGAVVAAMAGVFAAALVIRQATALRG